MPNLYVRFTGVTQVYRSAERVRPIDREYLPIIGTNVKVESCTVTESSRLAFRRARDAPVEPPFPGQDDPLSHIHHAARLMTAFLLAVFAASHARPDEASATKSEHGAIEGVVTYVGDVPRSKIRDNAGNQHPLLDVARKSRGLRYALVYFEQDVASTWTIPAKSSNAKQENDPVQTIDQINHEFQPHLVAIRDGEKIKFTNSDPANHNVQSIALLKSNQFNRYTGAGVEYVHEFAAGEKLRPIALRCDIHPWMSGWIFVFKHSFYAVTNQQGRFRIEGVPPGRHQLVVRQPDIGYLRRFDVEITGQTSTRIDIEVSK